MVQPQTSTTTEPNSPIDQTLQPKEKSKQKKSALRDLLDEFDRVEKAATESLTGLSHTTRPGREIKRRKANERLPELKREYAQAVQQRWGAIFLEGDERLHDEFVRLAKEMGPEDGVISVSVDDFYQKVAIDMNASMRADRNLTPAEFAHLGLLVDSYAKDMGFAQGISLKFRSGVVLRNVAAIVDHVRALVVEAVGHIVMLAKVSDRVIGEALKSRYHGKVLVVLLRGFVAKEVPVLTELFGGRVTSQKVVETTENAVNETFDRLKQHYTKKGN